VTLGIVCGLKSEADALGLAGVAVSGARADVAEAAAARLADQGVEALLSIGLAGALDPSLAPAKLLVPTLIVCGQERFETSAALAARLGFVRDTSALVGSNHVVASPAAKAQLFRATGAAAVDMESHRVTRVALARGLSFLVIRVIADAADRAIPSAAAGAVREDGSVDVAGTMRRLAMRPWQLPAILALGRDSATAHKRLKEIGERLRRVGA
jgi:nucleoside phosphorylase